jgi:hypothetical protein
MGEPTKPSTCLIQKNVKLALLVGKRDWTVSRQSGLLICQDASDAGLLVMVRSTVVGFAIGEPRGSI